ncbi:MAG: phosphotransferase [Acetatifactor sp.]|nr:phosphotransferase [Acetatifactor sp.]
MDSQEKQMETEQIWNLFFDGPAEVCQRISTGIDEDDFRESIIGKTSSGEKYVLKIVDNDFTFPEKIEVWKRTVEEYRKLGYYAPRIITDKEGKFPSVSYQGRKCVAYAEEFAPYTPVEDRLLELAESAKKTEDAGQEETAQKTENARQAENQKVQRKPYEIYYKAMWQMTAKVAEKHFDYMEYPSAWCLFRTFCPSDEMDEVTENALTWKNEVDKFPEEFREQAERIFRRWSENREELKKHYDKLPTSVFQGDLNSTNLLVDEQDRFVGVIDFNLCGKEVVLNYLFRETHHPEFEKELKMIFDVLEIVREFYHFSEEEKSLALSLYRCLIPFGGSKIYRLKELKSDVSAIRSFLDETERYQTMEIDFEKHM